MQHKRGGKGKEVLLQASEERTHGEYIRWVPILCAAQEKAYNQRSTS